MQYDAESLKNKLDIYLKSFLWNICRALKALQILMSFNLRRIAGEFDKNKTFSSFI